VQTRKKRRKDEEKNRSYLSSKVDFSKSFPRRSKLWESKSQKRDWGFHHIRKKSHAAFVGGDVFLRKGEAKKNLILLKPPEMGSGKETGTAKITACTRHTQRL